MRSTTSADVAADITRHSPLPLVLLHLGTHQVLEASDRALAILEGTRAQVVGQLATTFSDDKQQSADALDLIADGVVQGYSTPRRLRRADGTPFEAWVWTRRVPGTDALFLVLTDDPVARDPHPVSADPQTAVVGVVDDDWRVLTVSTDVEDLLGVPADHVVGTLATDHVHPDDVPELLVAVGDALRTRRSAWAAVRFRDGDDRWRQVRVRLSSLPGTQKLAFVVCADEPVPTAPPAPELAGLSERQRFILERILDGSRVPAIARELYLSQSTVRNHLSQVFEKFGVHSQVELIELLRERQSA